MLSTSLILANLNFMKAAKAPKKRTRDLARTRQEILAVAFGEVFAKGFQGVSIDDIVKKTKFTKGAFYHQFPTKLDLGYALVDEVLSPMIVERWVRPLEDYKNPLEGILAQMQSLIGEASTKELRLGCPLNNLVQEMSNVDAGFQKRLQKALELWASETAIHLERAKAAGYLKKSVDVRGLAHFVVMAHEGFYGYIKGTREPREAFAALMASLQSYFKTLV